MRKGNVAAIAAFFVFMFSAQVIAAHSSFVWTGVSTAKIWFTIDDATATVAPHEVTLTVDTGSITPLNFILFNPNSITPVVTINTYPGSNNSPGITAVLSNQSGNVFVLKIDALPNSAPRGTISPSQDWYLTVNLPSTGTVAASISSLDASLVATNGAHLDVPPQASVSVPVSTPTINAGDTVDFDVEFVDLDKTINSYAWTFAGGDPPIADTKAVSGVVYSSPTGSYTATVVATDSLGQVGTASMGVQVKAPTMVIKQGSTILPDSTGSYLFDDTVQGGSASIPFTATNSGTGLLQFSGDNPVTLGGANPGSFTIVSQPDSATVDPPPATTSATFEIAFAPLATDTGTMSATVSIASNDPAQPSYSFAVSGKVKPTGHLEPPSGLRIKVGITGMYSGKVPFQLPLYAVGLSAASTLKWDITDATASGDIYETSTPVGSTTQTLRFETPEIRTVHFKAVAADGTEGEVSTMTIVAYPDDAVSFPRYQGLPFDNEPPWIDGTLSGWDDHLNPSGSGAADVVYGENGWRGAFSIPFSDGTEPDARIDLVRSGDALYFGIDVNFDDTLTAEDQIFIGIGKDEDSRFDEVGNVGLISITPLTNDITFSQKNASGGWDPVAAPAGLQIAHESSIDDDPAHWAVELKLPIGAGMTPTWLNLGNKFLVFARIMRYNTGSSTYSSFTWPRAIPATVAAPEAIPDYWGMASRDDSLPSNGLYFAGYSSIGVRADPLDATAPLANAIMFTDPGIGANTVVNRLVARVSNDAQRARLEADGTVSHEYLAAPDVRVTFKMAQWGVPSPDARYWTPIVAQPIADPAMQTANPTIREAVPPATAMGPGTKDFILDWKLNAAQIDQYAPGTVAVNGLDKRHQCLLAEIDTNPATAPANAVNVVSKSVYRNMDFSAQNAGGEAFFAPAEISAQGLESFIADLRTKNSGERTILLRVFTRSWKSSRETLGKIDMGLALKEKPGALSALEIRPLPVRKPSVTQRYLGELRPYIREAPGTISFIEYIVKAYVYTGRTTNRNDRDYEEVSAIGSYGYVVRHLSSTEAWDFHIEGARKIDDHTYVLTIKTDGTARITDHVRAIDPPRWSFGILGGAGYGIPNAGTFTPAGGGGALVASFNMGLDELNRDYSLVAGLGYDYLPGSDSGAAWNAGSLGLSFKAGFPFILSWFRPYLSVGGGLFMDDTASVQFGAALGTGIDIAVSRPVHIQLGADFMGTRTTAVLHINAGLIYRLMK
jgi:hypothetical protein